MGRRAWRRWLREKRKEKKREFFSFKETFLFLIVPSRLSLDSSPRNLKKQNNSRLTLGLDVDCGRDLEVVVLEAGGGKRWGRRILMVRNMFGRARRCEVRFVSLSLSLSKLFFFSLRLTSDRTDVDETGLRVCFVGRGGGEIGGRRLVFFVSLFFFSYLSTPHFSLSLSLQINENRTQKPPSPP